MSDVLESTHVVELTGRVEASFESVEAALEAIRRGAVSWELLTSELLR